MREPLESVALTELLAARLDRAAGATLGQQLYAAIRASILDGALRAGSRLPASRLLAADLAIARNTVIDAYAQLGAEGYVRTRVGAGTFVAAPHPPGLPAAHPVRAHPTSPAAPAVRRLSRRAESVLAEAAVLQGGAFAAGVPDATLFPFGLWQRLLSRRWRRVRTGDTGYSDTAGHPALRAAIAANLRLARQVRCEPEQVLVLNGAQQAIDLCARLLADAGERAWVEDPGYPGARRALRAADLEVVPIAVDGEGLAPQGRDWRQPPRLVYITPSHQFPLGTVMSLARRQQLLEGAARHDCWVIEDDYDGEFRHAGRPLAALQGIDRAGRVLYVGSFSKTLFPGLRLGYLVVPGPICERFQQAALQLSLAGRRVEQGALADFIGDGHYGAHIRRVRAVYAARRELLSLTWRRELGAAAPLTGADSGMHVVARLPPDTDVALSRQAAGRGIVAQSLTSLGLQRSARAGLVLGYGAVPEAGIRRLAAEVARLVAAAIA